MTEDKLRIAPTVEKNGCHDQRRRLPRPVSEPPPGYPPPGYPQPSHQPPGYPPPGYPQPSHQPPAYPQQGYPPPGYRQPDYQPPGYPPPGYPPPGYQPPGYGPPPPVAPALKPGIIPLRPLTLGDIFNGAVGYIRANPKVTLGFTAAVVVGTQIIALILQVGPLAVTGQLGGQSVDPESTADLIADSGSTVLDLIATTLSGVLLSGMLTVVVGRAVFGSTITIGAAWVKVRGRLPALIGLTTLVFVGVALLIAVVVLIIVALAAANEMAAVFFGLLLVLALIAALVYIYTVLAFAPVLIVLERLTIVAAITRSFALVRNSFWRVLGIRLLTFIVATFVSGAVAVPFAIGGIVGAKIAGTALVAIMLGSIGTVIAQIITAPFSAGVVVLLYTDRRIRAEAFDLVLQTGAAGTPAEPESADNLWLARRA